MCEITLDDIRTVCDTPRVMKNSKYLAEVSFSNGRNATATDNNIRRLKARIARNFAGEVSEWGFDPNGATITAARILAYVGNTEKLVWERE